MYASYNFGDGSDFNLLPKKTIFEGFQCLPKTGTENSDRARAGNYCIKYGNEKSCPTESCTWSDQSNTGSDPNQDPTNFQKNVRGQAPNCYISGGRTMGCFYYKDDTTPLEKKDKKSYKNVRRNSSFCWVT